MAQTHKMGIIGTGHIAHKMAYTVSQMEGYEICAVASRTQESANAFAAEFNIAKAYDSYQKLTEDPEVELIYIATPHSLHYEHASLCIAHHKPVLCEKAFTANAQEAEALIAQAQKNKVFITEAIWTRYMPLSHTIVKLIQEGAIGTPYTLSANLCYPISHKARLMRPELAGGALLDIGIYPLNFAAMVFGTEVEHTESSCTLTDTGMDAQECITQYFSGNRMANLYSSIYARSDRYGIISGDKGYMMVKNVNNPEMVQIFDPMDNLIAEHHAPRQITGFEYQVEACFEAIGQGAIETRYMPHEETIRMMHMMDELRKEWGVHYPNDERILPKIETC